LVLSSRPLLLVDLPQVPEVDWLVEKLQGFVDSGVLAGRPHHIWVNPGEPSSTATSHCTSSALHPALLSALQLALRCLQGLTVIV